MEEIRKQVKRARRRLVAEQFLGVATWTLFFTLLLALVALAIPKIWPVSFAGETWTMAWLFGSLGAGLVLAVAWIAVRHYREMDAAIEIDRRFGLKERVSSALALVPDEQQSDVGRALLTDAERRVKHLDMRDQFRFRPSWHPILPLLTATAVFLTAFLVQDARREAATAASEADIEVRRQIQRSGEQLLEELARQRDEMDEEELEDADDIFDQVEETVRDVMRPDVDRQKALIEMNNLTEELEEQRRQLEGAEEMRRQLNALPDIEQGPADRVANAIRNGDLERAIEEIQRLQERVAGGEMSAEQQEQLQNQLEQMQQELQDMVDAHDRAKQDLERRIEEARQEGDFSTAAQLEQQLAQMEQLDAQMSQMSQMAQQMAQSAQALQDGNNAEAAAQLSELAENMQAMQGQLEQLETLDQMMDQIAGMKSSMGCQNCSGEGCAACQGMGMQGMQGMQGMAGQRPGNGMGPGRGQGNRPEEEGDTGGFDSRVDGDPSEGEAVRTGDAAGPNLAGDSRVGVSEAIESAYSEEADPLNNVRLPRREREHSLEYFNRLREGD